MQRSLQSVLQASPIVPGGASEHRQSRSAHDGPDAEEHRGHLGCEREVRDLGVGGQERHCDHDDGRWR